MRSHLGALAAWRRRKEARSGCFRSRSAKPKLSWASPISGFMPDGAIQIALLVVGPAEVVGDEEGGQVQKVFQDEMKDLDGFIPRPHFEVWWRPWGCGPRYIFGPVPGPCGKAQGIRIFLLGAQGHPQGLPGGGRFLGFSFSASGSSRRAEVLPIKAAGPENQAEGFSSGGGSRK